jgi:maltokinase
VTALELISELAPALRDWLPEQRWFAGKDIDAVEPQSAEWLVTGDPGLVHALVTVHQGERAEVYQLLVGLRAEPTEHPPAIGTAAGRTAFEGTADPDLAGALLAEFVARGQHGALRFAVEAGVELEPGLRARPVSAEQSNTSIVFGDQYILKLYRRPLSGPHRDVDLHRALLRVGCEHVAEPLGIVYAGDTVLGFLQRFLPDAAEGWAAATASVRDLMAERDLHADEVGGDFAPEAHRLGEVVAGLHADLAAALGSRRAGPADVDALVDAMHARLDRVLRAVPKVAGHERSLRAAYDAVRSEPIDLQEIHGDLHLGQVLRTTQSWVVIDFEGEPAATAQERIAQGSPLRDVAGMLRSFDYAAHQLTVGEPEEYQLAVRAVEWSQRNRDAFLEGYAQAGPDPRERPATLRAFELDKAVYEVGYEQAHRPEWLPIPLGALSRLSE